MGRILIFGLEIKKHRGQLAFNLQEEELFVGFNTRLRIWVHLKRQKLLERRKTFVLRARQMN